MRLRFLVRCLFAVTLLVVSPTSAGDVTESSMVARGRAELISSGAQMASGTHVTLTGILAGPDGHRSLPIPL